MKLLNFVYFALASFGQINCIQQKSIQQFNIEVNDDYMQMMVDRANAKDLAHTHLKPKDATEYSYIG